MENKKDNPWAFFSLLVIGGLLFGIVVAFMAHIVFPIVFDTLDNIGEEAITVSKVPYFLKILLVMAIPAMILRFTPMFAVETLTDKFMPKLGEKTSNLEFFDALLAVPLFALTIIVAFGSIGAGFYFSLPSIAAGKLVFGREQVEIAEAVLLDSDFEMVDVPDGEFEMGGASGEANARPVHTVAIKKFKIMTKEVTFDEWKFCVQEEACENWPDDEGWARGALPVINVSFEEITEQFIPWLNKKTGLNYRLPSEAEWEYATRATTTTDYNWGDNINCKLANYGFGNTYCFSNMQSNTRITDSRDANLWGLKNTHGNVAEWVQDCWHGDYQGAPNDGTAWAKVACEQAVIRGGAWDSDPGMITSFYREKGDVDDAENTIGFRLVRDF